MTGPAVRAIPAEDLAGSVRQTLGELAKVSDALDSGVVPSLTMSVMLSTLAGELRSAAAAAAGMPDDGTAAVRSFLTAILEAFGIPRPAGPDDERAYLRTRSRRADEVERACQNILNTASDPTGNNWRWSGAWLKTAASDHGTAGYDHADPGSGYLT
jgi:hypothetical protein